ncbi:hypothetical protein LUX29_20410 [Aureimonas altamirensis]|uniref:hypothetical protein n=1 Tax=Aureimonas altamirensis TaxID=370622 RepID=UPI001E39CCD8|nr:hypothetical protein [Aureimonas altamirensis]UHD45329.1 hypothetical protein LUX29_20410 [Aureimonas altamirensis]
MKRSLILVTLVVASTWASAVASASNADSVERELAIIGVAWNNCPAGTISDQDMANGITALAAARGITPEQAIQRLSERSTSLENDLRARGELHKVCGMAQNALQK